MNAALLGELQARASKCSLLGKRTAGQWEQVKWAESRPQTIKIINKFRKSSGPWYHSSLFSSCLPLFFLFSLVSAGREHQAEELAALGLLTFSAGSKVPVSSGLVGLGSAGAGSGIAGLTGEPEAGLSGTVTAVKAAPSLVSIGPGLPALPKRLVERIRAGEYIDFGELPPAKGRSQPLPQVRDEQVVVQATDLISTRKTILDLAT